MKLNKLSLNTIGLNCIGLNRIGSISVGSSATDRPYISPDVLSSLAGVWIADGKSNTDPDRNIIKNKLPSRGGDFELLNFAYKLNSGYGKYEEDFTAWGRDASELLDVRPDKVIISDVGGINSYRMIIWKGNTHTKVFKAKVTGIPRNGRLIYSYAQNEGDALTNISIDNDGVYEFPYSYGFTKGHGFLIDSGTELEDWIGCTIEFIPSLQGSLCTDGVNDMIVSQNTVEEMGITDEVTVVSMIHQIDLNSTYTIATTNYIENSNSREHVRSDVYNYGKTGIYGYSASLINNTKSDIKNILGDKADYYVKLTNSLQTIFDAKFSVVGRISELTEASQVAWYWTFIAKRALTTDEINQVIAYYNLDKYVKPDIYYNVKKQGLTNDNHAQFGDKLIDYSGNGRDLQLFNIGWKGESGVGRYTEEFKNDYWLVHKDQTGIIKDGNSIKVVGKLSNYYIVYHSRLKATNGFKVKIKGIKTEIIYSYISSDKEQSISFKEDGIYDISASEAVDSTFTLGFYFRYNDINLDWTGLTIEIIPSNKGALCLDGINDFGKVINMPIYKDYTFIIDREILSIDNIGIIASKSESAEDATKHGAFIFEYLTAPNIINTWSYYKNNTNIANTDFIRGISYQSKYNYNGKDLIIGTSKDSDKLYLGTIRDNSDKYGNIAIYFLMSFSYSMNKFLIERQLKKYKAGTLYKDMVEFRPVIKSNIDVKNIVYLDKDSNVVKVGDYISIGSNIKTSITVLDGYKISKVSSTAFNNITIEKSNTDFIYDVIFYGIKKSPQKINLVIEQDSDYVQWNPNIKANVSKYSVTANIRKTDGTILKLVNGQFYSTSITGNLVLDIVPSYKDSDEVTNVVIDGKSYVPTKDSSGNYYRLEIPLVFPKEINITIQEYVRYEDIVQPYPVLLRFKDENNNEISWGDKIKLGSSITRIGSFNDCNLLKDIYTVSNAKLNGSPLPNTPHVVERQMVFTCTATWIFDDNEPNCILSPRLLRVPNSSYKILGHIPDISGHGNHGVFNNLAFTEESGVNEDGSMHLDGVDDYISIPTLSKGGKQVLMKVNWQKQDTMLYNQNPGQDNFAIFTNDYNNNNLVVAYASRNNGNTYIDGVVNNNILATQLKGITHNIVATNNNIDATITPIIGSNKNHDNFFAQMALYAFMLFDEISTDEGIKDLNDIVGIVSKVELPPYYWDTYGKTNTDADRDEIVNLASDEVSIQYPTDFTDTSVWEDMGAVTSSTILTLTTWAMGGDTGIGNTIKAKVATPAMKVKFITDGNGYLDYMYSGYNTLELPRDAGEYEVELPASTIVDGWGARFSGSGNGSFTIELLGNEVRLGTLKVINSAYDEDSGYKNNGIALDGVDDSLVNTDIPAFTDFTVIAKRIFLGDQPNNIVFLFKGDKVYGQGVGNALLMEYRYDNGTYANYIFSNANSITLNEGDISYVTPTDYNGQQMNYVVNTDNKGLVIGRSNAVYWKGVFYKLMLYPKTIDMLSINMLKNLFERDEIIDLNNPIFKK